jgi:pyruvate formate lyase activating enzyme
MPVNQPPSQQHVPAAERVGRVHSLESLGAVDGPGLRFVIFLQGCHFRCKYCHNPDTWDVRGGTSRTVRELVTEAEQYKPFMKASGGGVTVTGGEPMLQAEFVAGIFAECHKRGIHTTLDTNGYATDEKARAVLAHTDLILLDIKQMNPDRHQELVGMEQAATLDFAKLAAQQGVPMWIRYVVVPGWTDAEADVDALGAFVATLPGVAKVELLPYHLLGRHKWDVLGLRYTLEGVEPPPQVTMDRIRGQLEAYGLRVE